MPLSDKQKRFCEAYLIDLNATKAYKSVYNTKNDNSAAASAAKLLRNPKIQQYLQDRQKALQEKTGITQERVLKELASIAFSDIRKYYNDDNAMLKIIDLDPEAAAAIAGVEVDELKEWIDGENITVGVTRKLKRWDKVKALEMLARHLGMFEKDNKQLADVKQIFKIGGKEFEF